MRRTAWIAWALVIVAILKTPVSGTEATQDPETAMKDPDFLIQGEYKKDGAGIQVAAMGGGKFFCSSLKGGLPADGWDGKTVTTTLGDAAAVKALVEGYTRVERTSPTAGAKPPAGATVLFDGTNTDAWTKGAMTPDKLLIEGASTKAKFKNFKLHVEFRLPYKPKAQLGSQDRGNSGIYIFNRYEVQVLDTFGLHYFPNTHSEEEWTAAFTKDLGFKPGSNRTQFAAAMYHFKTPDVNAAYPPLSWQTYDIDFTAPKFEGDKKVKNARITVFHNGVKVHDDVELLKGTGAGGSKPEVPEDVIYLQAHGNPNRFRNIWIVPRD